jgi:hypothetical protein
MTTELVINGVVLFVTPSESGNKQEHDDGSGGYERLSNQKQLNQLEVTITNFVAPTISGPLILLIKYGRIFWSIWFKGKKD